LEVGNHDLVGDPLRALGNWVVGAHQRRDGLVEQIVRQAIAEFAEPSQ
jgi:hypothetical protein